MWFGPEKGRFLLVTSRGGRGCLTAESVQGAALALERVDDVHGGDRLALGVLRVRDRVADDVLQEDLQHASGLFVDQTGDALHPSSSCKTTDSGLGYALDVVAEHLAMTFRASFTESLTALAASGHCECVSTCVSSTKKSAICLNRPLVETVNYIDRARTLLSVVDSKCMRFTLNNVRALDSKCIAEISHSIRSARFNSKCTAAYRTQ
jgi:hypothetical protein